MKFSLQLGCKPGRCGIISHIARLQGFQLETPHAFLYTEGGTVPHLTHEVLEKVLVEKFGLNIPVQTISHLRDQIKLYNYSVAEYIGMKEYLTYCSYINPLEREVHNSDVVHGNNSIGLWTRNGRHIFSVESYMEFIEGVKPDMFLVLADGSTISGTNKKKIKTSFDNNVVFFEKCMKIYKDSNSLRNSEVLGAAQGGFDLQLREEFGKLIGESSVFGVVIDGLHDCNETVLDIKLDDIKPFIKASLKHIPEDKLRIIHGCWNPNAILDLIEMGIDVFDSSYPSLLSDKGAALIFPNTECILEKFNNNNGRAVEICNDKKSDGEQQAPLLKEEEPLPKKIKLSSQRGFHISLLDSCHITDFTPIDKSCTCLTCRNHTRAYVHHLISVKEMLGSVLLMIHNLHHYLQFLETVRKVLKCGKFEQYKKAFQSCHEEISEDSKS